MAEATARGVGTTEPHSQPAFAVVAGLGTDMEHGLTAAEAARRSAAEGPNRLPEPPPERRLVRFAAQFRNGMVALLGGASVVAFAFGQNGEAALILAIVLANAVLGYVQESRAHAAMQALRDLVKGRARVVRDGLAQTVLSEAIVRGDVVLLSAGDRVPADIRLTAADGLEVDESTLTGESVALAKDPAALAAQGAPLAERPSMAFAGTLVAAGIGRGVVTAMGERTVVGQLVASVPAGAPSTPLQVRLDRLATLLLKASVATGAVLGLLAWAYGETPENAVLVAVSLAVAVVPEGLPAVVTVTLALGMRRMATQGAVVRRLHAVETLGSTTIICSDKTGTLTENRMAVAGCEAGDPEETLRVAALACDAEGGSPEESAILEAAAAMGFDRAALLEDRRVVAVEPFDARNRRMVVTVEDADGRRTLYAKGAPEAILPLLGDARQRTALQDAVERSARKGRRLLLAAYGESLARLTPAGLILFSDPPRREAAESIRSANGAGVRTMMITGDHPQTAHAIASELGLARAGDGVMTGAELDAIADDDLSGRLANVRVLARVEPRHKLRAVQALQESGEVVAMTGDGVNDVPALAAAHIGVAMGRRGTDAAVEASDMVLTDDDYSTIVRAIALGRAIHDNVARFVHFLLATNAGAMLLFATAIPLGLGTPLTVTQILIVNLLTDGLPAVALGLDPPDPGVMRRRPRPMTEGLLDPLRRRLALAGLTTGLACLIALLIGRSAGTEIAQTMVFTTLVAAKLLYVFSVRGDGPPWCAGRNPLLLLAVGLSAVIGALVLYLGAPLTSGQIGISLALGTLPLLVGEAEKWFTRFSVDTRRHSAL